MKAKSKRDEQAAAAEVEKAETKRQAIRQKKADEAAAAAAAAADDGFLLDFAELRIANDVFVLARDTFLPRNTKLRSELNMKPRVDAMIKRLGNAERVTTRPEFEDLAHFAQKLKEENIELGTKLTAAANAQDVTIKAVADKTDIVHTSLFTGHSQKGYEDVEDEDEDDEETKKSAAAPAPGSAPAKVAAPAKAKAKAKAKATAAAPAPTPTPARRRHPWVPAEMDDSFSPFEEEEIMEDVWLALCAETVSDMLALPLILEAADEYQKSLIPVPERRHSTIVAKPERRDSVKLQVPVNLKFAGDSAHEAAEKKQAELLQLPAFMQPLVTLESKRGEGLRLRAQQQKKMHVLLSALQSGGLLPGDGPVPAPGSKTVAAPPHPPSTLLGPSSPSSPSASHSAVAAAPAASPVPPIRSQAALHTRKRQQDFERLMTVGFGCEAPTSQVQGLGQGQAQAQTQAQAQGQTQAQQGKRPATVPRFMRHVGGPTSPAGGRKHTSAQKSVLVLEGLLGRGTQGDAALSTNMSTSLSGELDGLYKAMGLRARNASVHFGSAAH